MNLSFPKLLLLLSASQAMLAVIAGAFGAHALKQLVPIHHLNWWETGCQYLMYHALASLFCAWCSQHLCSLKYCVVLFTLGNIFFTGSLFIMMITGYTWLGAITPIGGLLYIIGWLYMMWCFAKHSRS